MLCAIYARLSKEDEEKRRPESESIQNQKALLLHYAAERGWEVYDIYCDEDYSGADALRPGFNRMLAAAQAGRFQIILCKSQSRFTRDMELVEKYIHGLLPLWGVRFIAVADHADTQVKGNKKARQINGLINEWYLEDLSDNIRMVLDMKRREGQYIGSSPVYGYQRHPADKHRLVVDPGAAPVVAQIFRWALEGHGKQEIAHMLNDRGIPNPSRYKEEREGSPARPGSGLWNKTTVWRILHNEMYAGVMVQGRTRKVSYKSKAKAAVPREQWFRVEGTHEAIVDPAVFEAVQRALALRARSDGAGETHVLSGLVRCMDCGSTLSRVTTTRPDGRRVSYLRCRRYAESGAEKGCTRHSIRLDDLIRLVTDQARRYLRAYADPEDLAPPPPRAGRRAALERERSGLAAQLARHDAALRALYLDRASGAIGRDQFAALNQAFLQERDRLSARLAQLDRELEQTDGPPTGAEWREQVRRRLELETLPRELAVLLIEKIEVGEKDPDTGRQAVRVTWRF